MNLTELKLKQISEVIDIAEALGLENVARSRKQDLIFAILKKQAKAGDDIYGDGEKLLLSSIKKKNFKLSKAEEEERPLLARQALHAHTLHFELNGTNYQFEAPIPKDLAATLKQLDKWNSEK